MKQFGKVVGLATVAVVACSFIACTNVPDSMSKGKEKMEDCGYTVETLSADDISEMFGEGIHLGAKTAISCVKEADEEMLLAIWFEDGEKAEDFETVFEMAQDMIEAELGDIETKYEVEGEVFYYGTSQACKDFTK